MKSSLTKIVSSLALFIVVIFLFTTAKSHQAPPPVGATGGITEEFEPLIGEIVPTGSAPYNYGVNLNDTSDETFAALGVWDGFPPTTPATAISLSGNTEPDTVFHTVDGGTSGSNADGSFIAWGEEDSGTQGYEVYIASYSNTGVQNWVNTVKGSSVFYDYSFVSQMVADNAGGVFVLRLDGEVFGDPSGTIFLDHINSSGTRTNLDSFDWYNVDMVTDGAGGVYVMTDMGDSPDENFIGNLRHGLLFRYTSSGLVGGWPGGGVAISTNGTSTKGGADLITDGNGGAIVVWADDETSEEGIYAQRIDSTGTVLWATRGELLFPSTTLSSDYAFNGDFIRAARRDEDSTTSNFIAFSDDGELKVLDFANDASRSWQCVQSLGSDFYDYDLVANLSSFSTDDVTVVWEGDSGVDRGLYTQRFAGDTGHSIWSIGGELLDDAVGNGGTNFDVFLKTAYGKNINGVNVNASGFAEYEESFGSADGARVLYSYNDGSGQPTFDEEITFFEFASSSATDCFPPEPLAPTLINPADGALVGDTTPVLSAQYAHGLNTVGFTNYRVTDTDAADCLAGANLVDSGTSATTSTGSEPTSYEVATTLSNSTTYFWCAQNDDGTLESAWTTMGEFTIDTSEPYLDYLTYLGGANGDDLILDVVGYDGDAIVTGRTDSSDFPTTSGVIDEVHNSGFDVFVSRISPDADGANDLSFSTYIGGSSTDRAESIDVDGSGAIHITGYSSSTNYPTTSGAFDETKASSGDDDVIMSILSSDGTSLSYSTYIEANDDYDRAYSIDVDDGLVYLVGETSGNNLPTTTGAYDETYNSGDDIFMAIINPAGGGTSDLQYLTYLGTSSTDEARGVVADDGLVHIVGRTNSSSYPTFSLGTEFQSTRSGSFDGIVTVIDPQGAGSFDLLYSSFLGGGDIEFLYDVDIDPVTGYLYIVGSSESSDMPTTTGAYEETKPSASGSDSSAAFFVFNPSGLGSSDLVYGTHLAGTTQDNIAFGVDYNNGIAYVVGQTDDTDFPITSGAFDATSDGTFTGDVFISFIDPSGNGSSDLVYSSYLSGEGDDFGRAIAFHDNKVFFVGDIPSSDLPTTSGAYQEDYTANDEGFIACLDVSGAVTGCAGAPPDSRTGALISSRINDIFSFTSNDAYGFELENVALSQTFIGVTDGAVNFTNTTVSNGDDDADIDLFFVADDESDGLYVGYGENYNASNGNWDLYVSRVNGSGIEVGGFPVQIASGAAFGRNYISKMIPDGANGVFVLYLDVAGNAGGFTSGGAYLAHIQSDGTVSYDTLMGGAGNIDMASGFGGDVYVVTDMGVDLITSANGNGRVTYWDTSGQDASYNSSNGFQTVSTGSSLKSGFVAAPNASNGVNIYWIDDESGSEGLYYQNIDGSGDVNTNSGLPRGELLYASTTLTGNVQAGGNFYGDWSVAFENNGAPLVGRVDFDGFLWDCVVQSPTNSFIGTVYDWQLVDEQGYGESYIFWEGDSGADRGLYGQLYEYDGHSYAPLTGRLIDDAVSNGGTDFEARLSGSSSRFPASMIPRGRAASGTSDADDGYQIVYSYATGGVDDTYYLVEDYSDFTGGPGNDCVILPDAIDDLVATPGDAEVTLNWTAPSTNGGPAITDYTIYFGETTGFPGNQALYLDGSSTATTATISAFLTNGTNYSFTVYPITSNGTGPVSNTATATPSASSGGGGGGGGGTVTQNLGIPQVSDPVVLGPNSIQYPWAYVGSNHAGFRIINETGEQLVELTDPSARTWDRTGLEHNSAYNGQKIRAFTFAGNGGLSSAWPTAVTEIIPVTPTLVSRIGTEIVITTAQTPNNLALGDSGIQFELIIPETQASADTIITSDWQQSTTYTFTDIPLDADVQVRTKARNQVSIETPWSQLISISGGEALPAELLIGLSVQDINGNDVTDLVDPKSLLFATISLQNSSDQTANNVFVNLPLPQHLNFVPGSLQVGGNIQTNGPDQDFGQGNSGAVSVIFPEVAASEIKLITFQLAFDIPGLEELASKEAIEEQIREEFLELEQSVETIHIDETTQTTEDRFLETASVIAAANPVLPLQASASASNVVNPVFSNIINVTPNLAVLAPNPPTPVPPTPVPPTPTPPSPPSPTTPTSPTPTTPPTPGPSPVAPPTGGGSTDELLLTGNAQSAQEQIEFTGTTSKPNSTITVTFNNRVTRTLTSDENGIWRTFVSADELGILEGETAEVQIRGIAQKDDLTSNTVIQNVTVTRAIEGEVVVEIDEVVSEESFLVDLIEEQEEVIETTLVVAAPVILASSLPLWGYLPYLPTLLFHLISWLLGLFGKDKKGRLFGIVYDSITKQPLPLAIVRVYDAETKKLVKTEVTNKEGRYEFLLEPRQYTLEAKKPTYLFPSKIVSGSVDGDYQHVYNVSAGLNVTPDKLALPDLPLDPQNAKRKFQLANIFKKLWIGLQAIGHYLALPMLFVGALISIISVVTNPENIIYWILAIVYVLMLVLQLIFREHKEKAWGIVYEVATNAPLPLVSLQLVDPEFGKVVKSRLSDYEGRFSFLPEPGKYVIKANKQGYVQPEVVESRKDRNPLQGEIEIQKKDERITGDIPLVQQ